MNRKEVLAVAVAGLLFLSLGYSGVYDLGAESSVIDKPRPAEPQAEDTSRPIAKASPTPASQTPAPLTPGEIAHAKGKLAALQAQIAAGVVKVAVLRPDRSLQEQLEASQPPPRYAGTRMIPDPEAKGEMLAFQKAFAKALCENDPRPQSRLDHFSWVPQGVGLTHIGWSGSVQTVEPQADGSSRVKVRFFIWLSHPNYRVANLDEVHEVYRYSHDGLQLVDSE